MRRGNRIGAARARGFGRLAAVCLFIFACANVWAQPSETQRREEDERLSHTKQADGLVGPVRAVRVEKAKVYRLKGKYTETGRRVVETGAYDAAGRRTEITYRDERGELTARTVYSYEDGGRRVTSSHFDRAGKPTGTELTVYDRRGNKSESVYKSADGATRQRWLFTYDSRGNRTAWEFRVPGASTAGRHVITYDGAGRKVKEEEHTDGVLQSVTTFDEKGREAETAFFLPDGTVHNKHRRRYRGNAVEWLTYGRDGGLEGRIVSTYDAKGRLLRRVVYGGDGKPSGVDTYTYDAYGNESRASFEGGALVGRTAVRAGAGGRRRVEVFYGPGGEVLRETTYVREYDARGNWVRETAFEVFEQGGRRFFGPFEVTYRFVSYHELPAPRRTAEPAGRAQGF